MIEVKLLTLYEKILVLINWMFFFVEHSLKIESFFLNIHLLDGGGDGVGDGVAVAEPIGVHQLGGGLGGGDESRQNNLDKIVIFSVIV